MNGGGPRIILDGAEGAEGRALLLISALHHCSLSLAGFSLRFIDVDSPAVEEAVELLRADTGLDATVADDPEAVFPGARLYAAVRFRGSDGLRLDLAAYNAVRPLTAVQFPEAAALTAETLPLARAAHDPEAMANALARAAGTLQ